MEEGVEVLEYVTPFSLELKEDGGIVKGTKESSHPMILLVFKQLSGKVKVQTRLKIQPQTQNAYKRQSLL